MSLTYIAVAPLSEIPQGGNRAFQVDGHDILICHTIAQTGSEVYAVRNLCTHQQSALAGGPMRGCYLFCPVHGARFDLRDGSTRGKLAKGPIATYPVRVSEGMVEVALTEA